MMISWPVKQTSTAFLSFSTSRTPPSSWNLMRLRESKLQAVSSTKTNSLQGFVALMRAKFGTQCQSWIVVSNWIPGSPQTQAASAISFIRSRALCVSMTRPPTTALVFHSASSMTASMNSSVTRTEWLAFWNWTES